MDEHIEQKLLAIFENSRLITFNKGETIYRPGQEFAHVGFIKSGYVRLYANTKDGSEFTINLFKPIFYLTLMYAQNGEENRFFFEAITDVSIWMVPKQLVLNQFAADPKLSSWLNGRLLRVISSLLGNIEESNTGNSQSKIASIIQSLANTSGTKNADGSISIDFQTSHRIIASLAGLARETASIQIKRLEEEGVITQDHHTIVITNPTKLKEISNY